MAFVLLAILCGLLLASTIYLFGEYWRLRGRYSSLIDIDEEARKLKLKMADAAEENARIDAADLARRAELNTKYQAALKIHEQLSGDISLLEGNLEDISFGIYKPQYSFETSEAYRTEVDRVRYLKKAMVKSGGAVYCGVPWSINNSRREGEKMAKQQMKLMLRAFNGECDAAVAKATWNNMARMEERIRKAMEAINEIGSVIHASITYGYLDLAIRELRLAHEYELKKHEEREEQRHLRERMREEEREQHELERAKNEAAAEQLRYEKALIRARAEAERAKSDEIEQAKEKVRELEGKLAEAAAKMRRATSMAELTRLGYVYVISNIGSFGEQVYKIGMTRRLDPMERVHELGSAAVPFAFDVHAMIFSEDAPKLENVFHREFSAKRLNLVNSRKEYFRVSIEEIEAFARRQKVEIEFTRLAEAREYRTTIALKDKAATALPGSADASTEKKFPEQLF